MPKLTPERIIDTPFAAVRTGVTAISTGGSGGGGSGTYTAGHGITIDADNKIHVDVSAIVEPSRGIEADANDRAYLKLLDPFSGLTFSGVNGALMLHDDIAGNGLTITDKVLSVGAGDGIVVGVDSVAVDASAIIDTNSGLAVTSNDIRINLLSPFSGLTFASGALALHDDIAGAGLTIGSKVLSIDLAQHSGLTLPGGKLALGTPGALSFNSTDAVTDDTHWHSIVASSDVSDGSEALLKSSSEGGLGLASLFTSGAVDIGQGLTAAKTGFRVIYHTHDYDHAHVVINPGPFWNLDEQFGLDIDDNLLVRGWIVGKHAIQLDGATMLLHFDGPERSPDLSGQTRGHMGQVPTLERSLTFAPGKFGMAVHVPPATTNMITNPSFETGAAAWGNYSSGNATGTRQRTTELSYAGNYSYRLQKTGGAVDARWGIIANAYPVTNGKTYTVSAWVNITAASGGTGAFRMELGGVASAAINIAGPTDGWQRITRTVTAGSTGNLFIHLFVHNADTMTAYVDAVQLEEQGYATPYADGSLGSGHSWSGSEHASASSRLDGSLDYNAEGVINRPKGSFMAWVKAAAVDNQMVMSLAAGTWIRLSSNGAIDYAWGGTTRSGVGAYTVDTWYHVALTWEGTTVTFYVNGVQVDQTTANNLPPTGVLSIGYYRPNNNQRWTGLIDDVVILNRAADADEIRAVYESNAPVFAETSTWHWRAGRNRIYADAEGLWGYGASGAAIIGLYAGSEDDPSATKSWGGVNMSEGDFLLGRHGANNGGWLYFDQDLTGGEPGLTFGYGNTEVLRLHTQGAQFTGVFNVATSGGIYQGTGTFASPNTGLKIWNEGGIGRIGGWGGGTQQWGVSTQGRLFAGGGNVNLDNSGLWLTSVVNTDSVYGSSVTWYNNVNKGTEIFRLGTFEQTNSYNIHLKAISTNKTENNIHFFAQKGNVQIAATKSGLLDPSENSIIALRGIEEKIVFQSDDIEISARDEIQVRMTAGMRVENHQFPQDGEWFYRNLRWTTNSSYVTIATGIVQGAVVRFVTYDTDGGTRYIEPGVALENSAPAKVYTGTGLTPFFIRVTNGGELQIQKNNGNMWVISIDYVGY